MVPSDEWLQPSNPSLTTHTLIVWPWKIKITGFYCQLSHFRIRCSEFYSQAKQLWKILRNRLNVLGNNQQWWIFLFNFFFAWKMEIEKSIILVAHGKTGYTLCICKILWFNSNSCCLSPSFALTVDHQVTTWVTTLKFWANKVRCEVICWICFMHPSGQKETSSKNTLKATGQTFCQFKPNQSDVSFYCQFSQITSSSICVLLVQQVGLDVCHWSDPWPAMLFKLNSGQSQTHLFLWKSLQCCLFFFQCQNAIQFW